MPRTKLADLASVIRSKNAGPYELTFDIIFKEHRVYRAIAQSGVLDAPFFAALYRLEPHDVLKVVNFDPAGAIKATIRRPIPVGEWGERDIYGAQQHAPLLQAEIEWGE